MVGERIKQSRLALGYSAEQVAAFLNISPATVYRYENGDISKLPSKFIKPLADFLCVTPAYLMGWDSESSSSEDRLLFVFRSLSAEGQDYLLQQASIASAMFGKKQDHPAADSSAI